MSNCCNPNQRIQDEIDELYAKLNQIIISELPLVSDVDNGKFLRVVNGVWAPQLVPCAEDSKF